MRTLLRVAALSIPTAGTFLLGASLVHAVLLTVPEYRCQAGRYKAAGQYAACEAKAQAHLATADEPGKQQAAVVKCLAKYAATWVKLQAKASGTGATCDAPRFVDNTDGTVTDNLTALVWEQKTGLDSVENPANPHDADNRYTWNAGAWEAAADGTAFTDALPPLNQTPCLGDMCDWRLPTFLELQTLLATGYPCITPTPCVDPTIGPTKAAAYWSSTSDIYYPYRAWTVAFSNGAVDRTVKTTVSIHVRAVRGGL
jgi:hypothetical protein